MPNSRRINNYTFLFTLTMVMVASTIGMRWVDLRGTVTATDFQFEGRLGDFQALHEDPGESEVLARVFGENGIFAGQTVKIGAYGFNAPAMFLCMSVPAFGVLLVVIAACCAVVLRLRGVLSIPIGLSIVVLAGCLLVLMGNGLYWLFDLEATVYGGYVVAVSGNVLALFLCVTAAFEEIPAAPTTASPVARLVQAPGAAPQSRRQAGFRPRVRRR
jgi:hypothetical protein